MKPLLPYLFILFACLSCSEQSPATEVQAPPGPTAAEQAKQAELRKENERISVLQRGQAEDVSYQAEMLGKLSAEGLKSIKAGQQAVYFTDPSVNRYFLDCLKARAGEWKKFHGQQLKEQATSARRERADNAAYEARLAREGQQERASYAQIIRNDFLDNSLDIKVSTSGPHASQLTLTYPLFSAVWTRRLETGGGLAGHTTSEWQEKGFTKVTLTDGYDYSASFNL
ncbi:hypothetical protein FNT36_24250 [Hymenobacter setariae]|jgi:hypothetical protein|uniref:Uncharacterized protein n=1 Tax=Hymenobacter setariae TaxID=2594794 RepID=A0A558BKG5_9BACT|nr:hypothetical protein [Hymenobacter setariae]TVT36983.1 hypothetical protein FNT36_24250 [Hymenobacter setariae]